MTALLALIKRELLEHRTAFIIAPAVLLTVITVTLFLGLFFGAPRFSDIPSELTSSSRLYEAAVGIGFVGWSIYLIIALVFYFSDSFSADRKNNAMLFWKSMPQSDLKILTSKALAGVTIFPALIFVFGLITGAIIYVLSFRISAILPFSVTPDVVSALGGYVQVSLSAIVFFALSLLWYAPILAWVAGLSTHFGGWSIPLAIVIPATATALESIYFLGDDGPIGNYLGYRLNGILGEGDFDSDEAFINLSSSALDWVTLMLTKMDWMQTIIGLIFTVAVVYIASEYRRHRLAV